MSWFRDENYSKNIQDFFLKWKECDISLLLLLLFIIYYLLLFHWEIFFRALKPCFNALPMRFFSQWGADFSEFKTNQLLLNSLSIIQARNFSREDAPFFFFFEAIEVLSRCSHLLPHALFPALHLGRFQFSKLMIPDPLMIPKVMNSSHIELFFHQTNQNDSNSRERELFWISWGEWQCLTVLSKRK